MTENKTQIELFPRNCAENGHNFTMAGEGYYKDNGTDIRDKLKVFRMIFCTFCGHNLEIIVVNRTPLTETKPKPSSKRILKKRK